MVITYAYATFHISKICHLFSRDTVVNLMRKDP